MKTTITSALYALCSACLVNPAAAVEKYPEKAVKLVIPFTPGGSNDVLARVIGQELSAKWKQPVVAENKPGAAGNIGAELVARSQADGYTLLIAANNVMSVNPVMYRQNFDPAKDFSPITLLGTVPVVLVINPSVPAKSLQEFVSYAKAHPGTLNYASSGAGSPQHLSAELFKSVVGVNMTHIPYKGAAPATADLLAGQVHVLFAPLNSVLPHIQAGKLRALALGSKDRSPLLPGIPTVAESGYPSYESDIWVGLVAPTGTPTDVLQKINQDTRAILTTPGVQKSLSEQGIQAKTSSPEEFRELAAQDLKRWSQVIQNAGISAESR